MTVFDLEYARQLLALEHKPRKLFNTPDDIQARIDAILNNGQSLKSKVNAYKPVVANARHRHLSIVKPSLLRHKTLLKKP